MSIINLVDGEKGGVGKSMFSRCFAHYLECEGIEFVLVDADNNNDVAKCYDGIQDISFKFADEEIALSSTEAEKVDKIFDYALEKTVLVNLPANVHEQVAYWIRSNDLLTDTMIEETGVRIIKWFLCSGEHDSLQAFFTSLDLFEGKLPHIFVRNRGLHTNWADVEEEEDYKKYKKKHDFTVIDFAGLRKAEQIYIQKGNSSLSLLLEDKNLPILSKQRLTKFLKETSQAIKQTNVIQISYSESADSV